MEVIPAIDLRGGRCVRLYQGDYGRETVFSDDPGEVARGWVAGGAPRLHVVDLDGARAGGPVQAELVMAIGRSAGVPVQAGGGIRDAQTVRSYLDAGVDRCVLGTVAARDPALVAELVREFGEGIVVGIDARDGRVATSGWTEGEEIEALDLARQLRNAAGVRRFIFTDIGRDGTLLGPNQDALKAMVAATDARVIASGGVASAGDVASLRETGVEGVIIGRALYTGAVSLADALVAAEGKWC